MDGAGREHEHKVLLPQVWERLKSCLIHYHLAGVVQVLKCEDCLYQPKQGPKDGAQAKEHLVNQ